ncbi:Sec-independent protein translocase subunit TatB [Streptomyces sp. H10-C2]|uniref:Sec-independent protein translocase subunit TatB n=1 Tax=unclassified Streptomyces TaxID=2593676 RepID=UPI0024B8FF22|nr:MULTISPECIES: Sec-independent protein translocase subunit TatB [unclassified Streptomyces]MDJ0347393.1 Sec-independent protein translocase subunit TatB [Streptomyces sp. PH10-H1]MDJ0375650.1 Sec-independent protein translocase subunit TatB [Streptomyces sp. H10-C2]
MFFGISTLKLLTILVVAALVFGPDKLPQMISEAMGILRKIRTFADGTKQDLRQELGPEFKDFEFEDLNPRTFIAKNLLAGDPFGLGEIRDSFRLDEEAEALRDAARTASSRVNLTKADPRQPAEDGPFHYDPDAT